MTTRAYFHGELVVKVKKGKVPMGARKMKSVDGYYKVADSETTGNFHLLEDSQGIDMYEKDGVMYLRNSVDAKISCADQSRHDTEVIPPVDDDEVIEISPAKEWDPYKKEIQAVVD